MIDRWAAHTLAFSYVMLARVVGSLDPDDEDNRTGRRDRGDVPGWVMITVMTAIVVVALVIVFKKQVTDAINNAFNSVRDSGGDK